jgi:hypothetical protein
MTDVVVVESNNSTVVQRQEVQNVVVDDKKATVVVTGMMPPPSVASITNSADVDLTQLQDGGILVYNVSTQKWIATNLLEKQIFEAGQF